MQAANAGGEACIMTFYGMHSTVGSAFSALNSNMIHGQRACQVLILHRSFVNFVKDRSLIAKRARKRARSGARRFPTPRRRSFSTKTAKPRIACAQRGVGLRA